MVIYSHILNSTICGEYKIIFDYLFWVLIYFALSMYCAIIVYYRSVTIHEHCKLYISYPWKVNWSTDGGKEHFIYP